MKEGNPKAIYLKDYQKPRYVISKVSLRFELFNDKTVVYAELHITANQGTVPNTPLELHGEQLKLIGVKLDGQELTENDYSLCAETLNIPGVPQDFVLNTQVEIDPANNTALEGLYLSSGNYCTQCEAEGFRKITYYLDRPDVMAVFSVRIEADKKSFPILLSNGDRTAKGELEDDRHFVEWHDPYPKPSYLFALVAGDLACNASEFVTASGRKVSIEIFTEEHNAHKCDHAIASLKKAMEWDEQRFGLEYDLDTYMIVAVDDFNMGAMENKGLNVFNSSCVLASPETATDNDYMHIEAVIAHEYFHNWTGNRVTCRDWFQLSLKEGLTVFRDEEFTSDVTSRAVKRIQDVRYLRAHQFAEDGGPMTHSVRPSFYVEINNFYTLTVYRKGAEVVRMYQTLLGQDGFRKGMDLYFKRHDGQAVTTDDFAAAMSDANDFDLGNFLNWYSQSGTPTVNVTTEWDAKTKEYKLWFQQEIPTHENQKNPKTQLIPIKMSLYDDNGSSIPLRLRGQSDNYEPSIILNLVDEKQEFIFESIGVKPTPSFLQNFSAPVKLNYAYSWDDYAFLMAHDLDEFNRWDAGQRFAIDYLLESIKAIQSEKPLPDASPFIAALKSALSNRSLEPAFLAEMLILPTEMYLNDFVNPIDVDAIHHARKALRNNIAASLETVLFDTYNNHVVESEYQYNADDMGKRKLAAVCLGYLETLNKQEYLSLSQTLFKNANNMTDTMAVLEAVNDSEHEFRENALNEFAQRWENDALVMDKWFSLQARSSKSDALIKVRELENHPCFSIKNPNKVRSLIGVFSLLNHTAFHNRDGSGYEFLAEKIIQLNTINPQIAARLVKPLIDWKKYDKQRQELMKASLHQIIAAPDLSKDVFEIVDRSLSH
ncbi:MAG: aminopeptidase N [Pseudomonadota bacterium]